MFKNLNKKFKKRLIVGFIFLVFADLFFYTIFENDRPIYINIIRSIFTSVMIVIGLAFFFDRHKKAE